MAADEDLPEDEADEGADSDEVPPGAAVFPEIPAELGVQPLLLAVLHAAVFLAGSDDDVVHPAAASHALDAMAGYLRRLNNAQLQRVREDLTCLVAYARQQKWPKPDVRLLKQFLSDFGIEREGER
jgi:hypothetical protein